MMLFLPITQNIVWLQFFFWGFFFFLYFIHSCCWFQRFCLIFRSSIYYKLEPNRTAVNRRAAIRTHSIATKPKLKIYFYYSSKRFIQRKILRDYNCVPFNREKCNYIPISVFLFFYWLTPHMLACFLALFFGDWIAGWYEYRIYAELFHPHIFYIQIKDITMNVTDHQFIKPEFRNSNNFTICSCLHYT